MDDYISREAVKLTIVDAGQSSKRYKIGEFWELNRDEAWAAIDSVPAADVAPARHGRWIPYEYGDYHWHKCSKCGIADKYIETDLSRMIDLESVRNYCPNCGARMDGEQG